MNYVSRYLNRMIDDEEFRNPEELSVALHLPIAKLAKFLSGKKNPNQQVGYNILRELSASEEEIDQYVDEEFGKLNPVLLKVITQKLHIEYIKTQK